MFTVLKMLFLLFISYPYDIIIKFMSEIFTVYNFNRNKDY